MPVVWMIMREASCVCGRGLAPELRDEGGRSTAQISPRATVHIWRCLSVHQGGSRLKFERALDGCSQLLWGEAHWASTDSVTLTPGAQCPSETVWVRRVPDASAACADAQRYANIIVGLHARCVVERGVAVLGLLDPATKPRDVGGQRTMIPVGPQTYISTFSFWV